MDLPQASIWLTSFFAVLPVLVAIQAVRVAPDSGSRWQMAVALFVWFLFTASLAMSGWLAEFSSLPPRIPRLIVLGFMIALVWSSRPVGRRYWSGMSLPGLVAFQGFRLPLELMMHRAYSEGLMPIQMSFSGQNFDIITGALALPLSLALARGWCGVRSIWAWNLLGVTTLLNVIVVAIRSFPGPLFSYPGTTPNLWVTQWPFCWLPLVLVLAALLGHTAITHKLVVLGFPLERKEPPLDCHM